MDTATAPAPKAADIKGDIAHFVERLNALETHQLDFRHELKENLLPILDMIVDGQIEQDAHIEDLGQAIDELIDQSEDALHPDTAAKFSSLIDTAKKIAILLQENLSKIKDGSKLAARQHLQRFRTDAKACEEILAEITIPLEDLEPEDAPPPFDPATAAAKSLDENEGTEGDDDDADDGYDDADDQGAG